MEWYRVLRWFMWSVLGSLIPFVAMLVARFMDLKTWPGLNPLFSSGQLLLTCVALLAGGIKELSGVDHGERKRSREMILAVSSLFALAIAMVYGFLANRVIGGATIAPDDQTIVTVISLVCLFCCLVITGGAVAVSAPIPSYSRSRASRQLPDSAPADFVGNDHGADLNPGLVADGKEPN